MIKYAIPSSINYDPGSNNQYPVPSIEHEDDGSRCQRQKNPNPPDPSADPIELTEWLGPAGGHASYRIPLPHSISALS